MSNVERKLGKLPITSGIDKMHPMMFQQLRPGSNSHVCYIEEFKNYRVVER